VLIEVTARLRLGDTRVPLIVMSARTLLSNFACHKKVCPVYMTIGNLVLKISQNHSTHTVIMVTLLPMPNKNQNVSLKWHDEERPANREVLNEVLQRVLKPLTCRQNRNAENGYFNIRCADGNFRRCKQVLAA
jgi:hypothetical protein